MKFQRAFGILIPLLVLSACTNSNDVGVVVRPQGDKMNVVSDSFHIHTQTISAGRLYSETTKPTLGHYNDSLYGSFRVEFLSEFRYARNYTYPESAVVDSLYLTMYYKGFFGDSSAVQEVSVFQLDKKALAYSENYYSDIDVSDFCSKEVLLGKAVYTAYDKTISDSLHAQTGFCGRVKVRMPDKLRDEFIANKDIYQSQEKFVEFFKGVYITNTYGSQTVLCVDSANLELSYHYVPDPEKPDSVVKTGVLFPANLETSVVVRVNVESVPCLQEKSDSVDFISAPALTLLQFELPWQRIYDRMTQNQPIEQLNVNNATLVVELPTMSDYTGRIVPPSVLLMIRKSDMDAFFTQSLYPAPGISTSLGVYDSSLRSYIFNNFGDYLENVLKQKPDAFSRVGEFVLVPVNGATDVIGTNAVIRHLYRPYATRLRSGSNSTSPFRLVVTHSEL